MIILEIDAFSNLPLLSEWVTCLYRSKNSTEDCFPNHLPVWIGPATLACEIHEVKLNCPLTHGVIGSSITHFYSCQYCRIDAWEGTEAPIEINEAKLTFPLSHGVIGSSITLTHLYSYFSSKPQHHQFQYNTLLFLLAL